MRTKKSDSMKFLDKLVGAPVSFGDTLLAIRMGEEVTQMDMAKKLGITSAHLSQIERGHKFVSPERAAAFAKKLGYPSKIFVSLSLQDQLTKAGLSFKVSLEAA